MHLRSPWPPLARRPVTPRRPLAGEQARPTTYVLKRCRGALAVLAAAGLLGGCGQAGSAATAVATYTSLATVDSGAFCIPDLNTTHISLIPLQPGGATGVVTSDLGPQQVRQGAVPAPPNSRLVAQGRVTPQAGGDSGAASALSQSTLYVYETSCSPGDVQAFYVATLLQNQWSGGFVPASGAAASGATVGSSEQPATVHSPGLRLFDLAALTTGRFVNVHPTGDTVVFITALAAIESPGTPQERHPTYVQVLVHPSASSAGTPTLPPTAATTPNVGASAAPPGGGAAP